MHELRQSEALTRMTLALERIATAVAGIEEVLGDRESDDELARRVMRAQQERARR